LTHVESSDNAGVSGMDERVRRALGPFRSSHPPRLF
jgi:hypothetical protein